ncbi:helix-turn-helix transcriptional regulator [Sulfitobacter sp. KE29]|uniref:helix-turn-helix domain-containing protein n=2 Tax=unclassified Sulfitobacter TaxID=196795 RepID=UPI0012E7F916|nr:helix-turn-helix transcriptional regulator [Sulfitobacter sp. KE29]
MMDTKFVKDVQMAGWSIQAVSEDAVIGKCPSAGCNLHAQLQPGAAIPAVDPGCRRNPIDAKIKTYDDIRRAFRKRRENLLLTIRELEEVAGLEPDLLAKVERDGTKKIPNVQTLLDWAGALGFELALRPVPMTPLALRTIVETRDKSAARTKRMTLENRRRGKKADTKR